jgi:hypothetical protein
MCINAKGINAKGINAKGKNAFIKKMALWISSNKFFRTVVDI